MRLCQDKNIEVFWVGRDRLVDEKRMAHKHFNSPGIWPSTDFRQWAADHGYIMRAGWYWWSCCPGCLPDGPAIGPFTSPTRACENALYGD
jgi:hypothetical protein